MHRQTLLKLLEQYKTPHMEEAAMAERTRAFVLRHENCFDRNLLSGHVTASAWVINPARTHVMMLHHRKLDLWLQPGGHADNDPDIHRVAVKEVAEEAGIDVKQIRLLSHHIFDIDVHTVFESRHDPRHEHFDIRFLMEVDDQLPLPGNDESHEIGWVRLTDIPRFNNARSLYRLAQKTRSLVG